MNKQNTQNEYSGPPQQRPLGLRTFCLYRLHPLAVGTTNTLVYPSPERLPFYKEYFQLPLGAIVFFEDHCTAVVQSVWKI